MNFEDSWIEPGSRSVGYMLQSLCNVWIVGAFCFSDFKTEFNAFSGYAIYFLIASGCSCRGACSPSQDQRREEEEEGREAKMEEDGEMQGMMPGVYPALP